MDWNWTTIWTGVYAIAATATLFVLFWAARWARRQWQASAEANALAGYESVLRWLQTEDTRGARKWVFGLTFKPFERWDEEDRRQAEIACHTYQGVALMVQHGIVKPEIVESWKPSIRRIWIIAKPLVEEYRVERPQSSLWRDLQALAEKEFVNPEEGVEEREWIEERERMLRVARRAG